MVILSIKYTDISLVLVALVAPRIWIYIAANKVFTGADLSENAREEAELNALKKY